MGKRSLIACLLALLLLAACAPRGEDVLAQYAPAQEDRLVIYTSHKEEVWRPIVKEFEERTGIWVDVVEGGTNEILERIAQEASAPAADVMFGGGVESLTSYRDCFAPYACAGAEELRRSLREPGDLWTPFSALPVVLIYNTKLVEPDQLTRWSDLFDPRYRGRIAFADPGVSGSSFTALVTLLCAVGGEEEPTLRAFAAQLDDAQLAGSGMVISAVAEGSALVGITLEETALKAIAAGEDIALVYPGDGTSVVPDASALVLGAPHENNAKRFLDFTISPEVQQRLEPYRRSVRQDVEAGPELAALDDIPLVDYDVEQASDRHDALLATWAFYLGGEETP